MSQKIIGILGLGVFGRSLAKELSRFHHDVIAIDSNPEHVQAIADEVATAAIGDFTDYDFLEDIGIQNCDRVVVASGNSLEASVLAVMHCKKFGITDIIAKARSKTYEEVLYAIGADYVISPEREMGRRLASTLMRSTITDIFQLEGDASIVEFTTPKRWKGRTLKALDIRKKYDLNLIGIREHKNSPLSTDIDPNMQLQEDSVLVGITNTHTFERYDYLGYFK